MTQPTLQIYETFASIQGESSYAGKPCFFIRLAGCQLNCRWCDTKKARSFESGTEMTIAQLLDLTKEAAIPLVEITGGEPLMQKNVVVLAQALLDAGFTVLMETNGAADCSILPDGVISARNESAKRRGLIPESAAITEAAAAPSIPMPIPTAATLEASVAPLDSTLRALFSSDICPVACLSPRNFFVIDETPSAIFFHGSQNASKSET